MWYTPKCFLLGRSIFYLQVNCLIYIVAEANHLLKHWCINKIAEEEAWKGNFIWRTLSVPHRVQLAPWVNKITGLALHHVITSAAGPSQTAAYIRSTESLLITRQKAAGRAALAFSLAMQGTVSLSWDSLEFKDLLSCIRTAWVFFERVLLFWEILFLQGNIIDGEGQDRKGEEENKRKKKGKGKKKKKERHFPEQQVSQLIKHSH